MFDFTGLISKFEENYNTNKDIRKYAAHMCKATTITHDFGMNEFLNSKHELFHNVVNPYPIQITYDGQNQLYDISTLEFKTYTFRSKPYNIVPQHFIETLVVSSHVKSIPNEMCKNLVGLKTVMFENGSQLQHMGNSCFEGCHSLKHINLPDTLKTIGECAFEKCYWLCNLNMASCNVATISETTFHNCYNLKTVSIPSSLKVIKGDSFSHCRSLTHLSLPEQFERFDYPWNVMVGCSSLKVLYLPNIDPDCFDRNWAYRRLPDGSMVYDYPQHQPLFEENLILLFDRATDVSLSPSISLYQIGQHIQSMHPERDPSVLMNWLANNSDGFQVAVLKHQMSILHILCHFPYTCHQVYGFVKELLVKCPLMIQCKDKTGRTALHHLIEYNPKRDESIVQCLSNGTVVYDMIRCEQCETEVKMDMIESISCANHEALRCQDEETGLMPFMFACMGEEYNLSVGYKLLQKMPEYLKNLQ